MNSYSFLEKLLHKIALSSNLMREITFDIDTFFQKSSNLSDDHIFISGLARSGSTILLNAIYESNEFASLSYSDMPFVLAPNLWSKISSNFNPTSLVERAHGDGIKISSNSPEAFEEVFWRTFDDSEIESHKKFISYVNSITQSYKKNRYLSKNNQNIKRVNLILDIFPNSKVLIPFRDPVQHANSLLTQHIKFLNESSSNSFTSQYMHLIGHTEFGFNYEPLHAEGLSFKDDLEINHWMEQWIKMYERLIEEFQDSQNVHFVCYEKLCMSEEYWQEILKLLNVKNKYDFNFTQSIKDIQTLIHQDLLERSSNIYKRLFTASN
jgi:hypothetical protein